MKSVIRALFLAAFFAFAAGASAQESDTARVPFSVNVNAAVSARPQSGGDAVQRQLSKDRTDTLAIPLAKSAAIMDAGRTQERLNAPEITASRGNINLKLPAESYQNAEISLHSVNGKRVLRCKAAASETAKNISRRNVAAGVYLLSVKGVNGASFATRLTHGGGKLNVSAAFGTASSLVNETAATPEIWNIRVSAAEREDSIYNLNVKTGVNTLQTITLRVATGFEPEMLALTPGATTAELRLAWYSDSANANNKTFVRVYGADGALAAAATKDSTVRGASTGKRYHKITVTGLAPNTQYKYSVSNNGTDWSYKYDYKTPKAGAFKFAAVGDQHQLGADRTVAIEGTNYTIKDTAIAAWKSAMTKIAGHDVDFIAGVGDQVDSGNAENAYVNFFAPPQMKNIPYAAAMGNHDVNIVDMNTQPFIFHFNLPNQTGTSLYTFSGGSAYTSYGSYWYLYNNVLFVVLNTGVMYPRDSAGVAANVRRFDTLFTNAKTAHAGKYDWIIVQHHESTKSVSAHAEDAEIVFLRKNGFETMLEKHGADVVLAGHDHVYVRTKPLKSGAAPADGKGTVYITLTAGASPKFYNVNSALNDQSIIALSLQNQRQGYAIFDVNGKSISFKAYRMDNGAVVDSLNLSKQ